MNGYFSIAITGHKQSGLIQVEAIRSIKKDEVRGRTLTSLISPGTEINACYNKEKGFPIFPGYATICEIEELGEDVKDFKVGDKVFLSGKHSSVNISAASGCSLIPDLLSPQHAVIARLMQVSMTSLITTKARPGDHIIISGFGPVGYLAAQMFLISGYNVIVVEPNHYRRELAQKIGIQQTYEAIPTTSGVLKNEISLVVECSGHEQAVLNALKIVRKKGEVVMVGVPWKKQTDISAHEILWEVFHKYVNFRTGWEWELPLHSSSTEPYSIDKNIKTAINWLTNNRINLKDNIRIYQPKDANEAYQGHLNQTQKELFSVFDWG